MSRYIQAGSCRPEAEWIATLTVPHNDFSSSAGEIQRQRTEPVIERNTNPGQTSRALESRCGKCCCAKAVRISGYRHRMWFCGRGKSRLEKVKGFVPATELFRCGCCVILSFTQAEVSVSRSGGMVSTSDKRHKRSNQLRGLTIIEITLVIRPKKPFIICWF